jgi:BirA family biotin operon repressor/biotin-[acetyl-CoA-carboxylase] ligase
MKTVPLSVKRIQAGLTTQFVGRHLYYFGSIGSTNVEAKRLAAAGAPEGTLVIADEQTAGKGRRGRRWLAPSNTCLLISLLFRPALLPAQASRLTMLCSLAAAEAIETETGVPVAIKWPNDLVVPHAPGPSFRKLGGILTETALAGKKLLFAIVGMGINVNVDPTALGPVMTPATSLLAELGRPVDRVALLAAILQQIENRYSQMPGEQIHADWAQRLITLGQQVIVTLYPQPHDDSQERLEGTAEGVDPDGALLLRDLAGNLRLVTVGDVTLRISQT